MIDAVDRDSQAIWATAFYAGLRLGELRALRWCDVDDEDGLIHVRRSWDPKEGEIEPKSEAGTRDIPVLAVLRPHLDAHATAAHGLAIRWDSCSARVGEAVQLRQPVPSREKAWAHVGLPRVTPHQARHSFASFLIAAGADVKTVTTLMGHGSARMSLDVYGHLFDGAAAETAAQVNAWLAAADTHGRLAELEGGSARS